MFRIRIEGTDNVRARYEKITMRLSDRIIDWLKDDGMQSLDEVVARKFKSQSDGVKKWEKLSEWTQREREALGFSASKPILVRTEELLSSLMGEENKRFVRTGDTMSVEAFPPGFKASLLNSGGVNSKGKNVPARPFMRMTEKEGKEIFNWFHKFFEREVLGL